ncbi:MAG: MarR family winged helix-turn-helix transcriptional regulator [Rhodoglobus sp.]
MSNVVEAALHAIFEANRLLRDEGERIAATVGQTHSRRMVLQAAADCATVPDIARRLGLQRQSVQRVADELVQDGLARYEDNPRHRVSRLLVPTTEGEIALAAIQHAHQEWIKDIERVVGEFDWSDFHVGLNCVIHAVRDHDPRE